MIPNLETVLIVSYQGDVHLDPGKTKDITVKKSVSKEYGHFDTKSFRYKSTRYKLKSFRDII